MDTIIGLNKKQLLGASLIVIFYLVGFIGFNIQILRPFFLKLVPFHLIWMAVILFYFQEKWNWNLFYFIGIVSISSFFIEVIGTNSGLLFGSYTYGPTLGFSFLHTPLLIGLNWLVLVYCVSICLTYLTISNDFFFATLGAALLTLLDVLIEPVAVKFNYWQWTDNSIPMQNYLAWFIISFAYLLLYKKLQFHKQNPLAIVTFVVQVLFFLFL